MSTEHVSPDDLKWPVVLTGGMAIHYAPADDLGAAYFGGPLEQEFCGQAFRPEQLLVR